MCVSRLQKCRFMGLGFWSPSSNSRSDQAAVEAQMIGKGKVLYFSWLYTEACSIRGSLVNMGV